MVGKRSKFCGWLFLGSVVWAMCSQGWAGEVLVARQSIWSFQKGTAPASSPVNAWVEREYEDGSWPRGTAPFYYGDSGAPVGGGTLLFDMRGSYTTVYLRKTFQVRDVAQVGGLILEGHCDDGFAAWINGVEVARYNVPAGDVPFNSGTPMAVPEPVQLLRFELSAAGNYLRDGENVLAIHLVNRSLSSSDLYLDVNLESTEPDVTAPELAAVEPRSGEVEDLRSLQVQFTEPVRGVDPDDLLVNGQAATDVSGAGDSWQFTFVAPPFGPVIVEWFGSAGVTDLAGNAFEPGAGWGYEKVDRVAPEVVRVAPAKGITVAVLEAIEVTFSEAVEGVDATDLLVQGAPARAVTGTGAGVYRFELDPIVEEKGVRVEWRAGHGITDAAANPNSFAGGAWAYRVDPGYTSPLVRINEIVASNEGGMADEDGERVDWLELVNLSTEPVNLAGWSLTDDLEEPGQWIFPEVIVEPGAYLVVFASGKDRRKAGQELHTNFKLSVSGEFLGLFDGQAPAGFVAGFRDGYPEQRTDVAYGYDSSSRLGYFSKPTPGQANGASNIAGVVTEPRANVGRGFFEVPFELRLWAAEEGVEIRYTLDGSEPTATRGLIYGEPVRIDRTRVVRAAGFREGFLPSKVATLSYVFLDQVVEQPNRPAGFPSSWSGAPAADYEMDPEVVRSAAYRDEVIPALMALPTVSLVTDLENLWGPSGIYDNPGEEGVDWERPVSMEWLEGEGRFQVDAGLRIQGGASRNPGNSPKHSFRVLFKGDYGPGKLREKVFEDSELAEFDTLVFRAGYNNTWTHWSPDQRKRAQSLRDQWARDTQLDMGHVSAHGSYVHLYLNGLYWGVYNLTERPSAPFAASYLGGEKEEYDAYNSANPVDGTSQSWNQLLNLVNSGVSSTAQYAEVRQWVDVTNLVDYILINQYGANNDWDHHNWYAARRRQAGEPFRFFSWDAERILESPFANKLGTQNSGNPTEIFHKLRQNGEFRRLLGDRIHKHLFHDGALTPGKAAARWRRRAEGLRLPLVAESARWGDYRRDVHVRGSADLYTVNDHWLPEQGRLLEEYFPGRTATLLQQYRNSGWYSSVAAPVFSQHGGVVPAGFELALNGPGTIYYTVNGQDPSGTGALVYGSPIRLDESAVVRARSLAGGEWSALLEARFEVQDHHGPLRLTEVMYNPAGGDPYEFIELRNVSGVEMDLGGYGFEGIQYVFPDGSGLGPGEDLILASALGPGAFAERYPGVVVRGYFERRLSNGGEEIVLRDRAGRVVLAVRYDDEGDWPAAADGTGRSLELASLTEDPTVPGSWVASEEAGGTPGVFEERAPAILLSELMADNAGAAIHDGLAPDFVEVWNRSGEAVALDGWGLSDNGEVPYRYRFPAGVVLEAGGRLVVWGGEAPSGGEGIYMGFGLKREGETVMLHDADGNRVDAVSFGMQVPDHTIARMDGAWQLGLPTPGEVNEAAPLGAVDAVVLNEFMANPVAGEADWVELYNRSDLPVDPRGMAVETTAGQSVVRSLGFIAGQGHLVLGREADRVVDRLDVGVPAGSGMMLLKDSRGQELNRIHYSQQSEGVSYGRLPDGASKLAFFAGSASPGFANYRNEYNGPRLNEVMARNQGLAIGPGGSAADWIEIFNDGGAAFDLSGMTLEAGDGDKGRLVFPPGAVLEAGESVVVWFSGGLIGRAVWPTLLVVSESLRGEGGVARLREASGQLADEIRWGVQLADRSVGVVSGSWRLLAEASPGVENGAAAELGDSRALRLNEWVNNPGAGEDDWLEIFNSSALPVDLGGMSLTDDLSLAGREKQRLAALSFVQGRGWIRLRAGEDDRYAADALEFGLNSAGESVRLYTAGGSEVDTIVVEPAGSGLSRGRLPDGHDRIVSFPETPSPGGANHMPVGSGVRINEVLARSALPLEDAIEIFNGGEAAVDLSGWWMSDSELDPGKHVLPSGSKVEAGEYLVIYEEAWSGGGDRESRIELTGLRKEEVSLWEVDASGERTGGRAMMRLGAAPVNGSFGWVDSSVGGQFVLLTAPTFGVAEPVSVEAFRSGAGAGNAMAAVGPLVVSEIHYHPATGGEEFVELANRSQATVVLSEPGGGALWRIRGGLAFDFTAGASIGPGQRVVLAGFDPQAEPARLSTFRAAHGISSSVVVWGPLDGRLGNGGDRVRVERMERGDDGAAWVAWERVEYQDVFPWPVEADGNGASLNRVVLGGFGNEPLHWEAAVPTPGDESTGGEKDRDGDGMRDDWELANGLDPDNAADRDTDLDGDGLSNWNEWVAGTDPVDAGSGLRAELQQQETGFGIVLEGKQGRTYELQTAGAVGGPWSTAGVEGPLAEDGVVEWKVELEAGEAAFFRIRVFKE